MEDPANNDPDADGPGTDAPASDDAGSVEAGGPPDSGDGTSELESLRQENDRLRQELEDARGGAEPGGHPGRGRRGVSWAMVVVGAILLFTSVLTVWVRNQVFDTDRYVETVAPLATDPAITSALADRIANRVSEELDIESLAEDVLPEQAAVLAGPIASAADGAIDDAATDLVNSDLFRRVWVSANRAGHEGVVAALSGRDDKAVALDDGKVVLKFDVLAERVLKGIDKQFGLDLADKVPADRLNVKYVLADAQQLSDVQTGVRTLDRMAWFGLIACLALLVGSVFVHTDRRRGLLHVGAAMALSMFLLLIVFGLGRDVYLDNLPDGVASPAAAAALFDTLTRFLLQATRSLLALGLVLLLAAWLAGPGPLPVRLRGYWNRALGRGAGVAGEHVPMGPVPTWVSEHVVHLRIAVAVVAALVLVVWNRPTGKVVLLVGLGALVALALLQFVAGMARPAVEEQEEEVSAPDSA